MATIAYIILQFESIIKKAIVTNHAFSTFITFSRINSLRLYQLYRNVAFIISNLQKDFHQDNLSFVCLQFYKHNCLHILPDNIYRSMQVKNQ